MVLILMVVGRHHRAIVMIAIPALLDAKFKANIVVVSLMLNSILVFLSIWVLKYQMRDPSIGAMAILSAPGQCGCCPTSSASSVSSQVCSSPIIAVILVAILFYKMVFGYKMRVGGKQSPCSQRPAAST